MVDREGEAPPGPAHGISEARNPKSEARPKTEARSHLRFFKLGFVIVILIVISWTASWIARGHRVTRRGWLSGPGAAKAVKAGAFHRTPKPRGASWTARDLNRRFPPSRPLSNHALKKSLLSLWLVCLTGWTGDFVNLTFDEPDPTNVRPFKPAGTQFEGQYAPVEEVFQGWEINEGLLASLNISAFQGLANVDGGASTLSLVPAASGNTPPCAVKVHDQVEATTRPEALPGC